MASVLFKFATKNVLHSAITTFACHGNNIAANNKSFAALTRFSHAYFQTTSEQGVVPAKQEILHNNQADNDQHFTKETVTLVNNQLEAKEEGRLFAVVHVAGKQFKVTPEDIILIHGHWDPKPGDDIAFEKVLMIGAKDFSLIGRPLLPMGLATVTGTVVEKDLSHTKTHFVKKRRKQYQRMNFIRSELTMVRINEVAVTGKVGEIKDEQGVNRVIY